MYYKKGWFFFRFTKDQDLCTILRGSTWSLGSHSFVFKKWHPNISKELDTVSKVPVWVTLPDLDPLFWSEKALSKIASKIGNPLYADPVTTHKERLPFARIMVEVDLSQKLTDDKLRHEEHKCRLHITVEKDDQNVQVTNTEGTLEQTVLQLDSVTVEKPLVTAKTRSMRIVLVLSVVAGDKASFMCGLNSAEERYDLWTFLQHIRPHYPWVCLGDFNCVRSVEERISDTAPNLQAIDDYFFQKKSCSLELTRVKKTKAKNILKKYFGNWNSICNYDKHYNGRIWVLFNPRTVSISTTQVEAQVISCSVHHFETNNDISLGFVYGSNDVVQREALWDSLRSAASYNPWMVLGAFNVVRCPEEKLSSNPPLLHEMLEFNSCVSDCHLDDISSPGCDMT
ncbi:uncharacterized protein LOC141595151 [Silene latifolia]|uniref:uncharacterized protein LOC141595151 n=1 Tax=Silene latifolia TaxID=37657 RepID=UPI003D780CC1